MTKRESEREGRARERKGLQRCPNENVVECRETIRGTCEKIAPKEKGEKEGEKK